MKLCHYSQAKYSSFPIKWYYFGYHCQNWGSANSKKNIIDLNQGSNTERKIRSFSSIPVILVING